MKAKRILALVLALTVGLMALPAVGLTAIAADDSLVLLDTNDKAAIKDAGFTADSKNVKNTKYSAKWEVDDAADKKVGNIPLDFSGYGQLSFSIMADSTENATVMVYFGSENSGTEGIDYWSYVMNLTPGQWQDVTIDLANLTANRTPLGWDKLSELSFRTLGWTNKAAPGTVVYIENLVLSGEGTPVSGSGTGEEDENNLTKVFYYNNYDDANVDITTGAGVMAKSNSITHDFDGDNGYVNISVTGDTDDCYIEGTLKSTKVNNLVVEVDLSTDNGAPSGNMQYKDTSADRKQGTLFSINANGDVTFSGDTKPATTLEQGTWAKLGFLIDFSAGKYTAYLDGKEVGTFSIGGTSNDLSIMRMYVNKSADNVGKNLLVDNFAVYGGTEFRDVSGEYEAPVSKIVATVGEDVPMVHPSLDDIQGGVALMLDIPDAYANGAMTKIDPDNEAVVPYTVNDRTLVPMRFISESFGAQVDWNEEELKATATLDGKTIEFTIGSDQMVVDGVAQTIDTIAEQTNDRTMLPLRALVESLGKNVLWDERGLIVITDPDVELDPVEDVKLSTMLIGLLENGIEASNYAAAPSFTQDIIDEAVAAPCGSWAANNGNSNSGEKSANIMYYLTLAARFNPEAAASDGTLCKDAVLKQLRHLIAGGNEPFACVGCYWGHAVVASALLLIKNTPVVYDELTADEKDRMDWLMRGLAIAGNWGFNDENNYSTGFDLMGNFGKGWNPNYRNTYLSIVLTASMYFGPEELDEIFTSFDYDTYIAKYEELGFTNILATWTVAGKDLMENGGECTLLGGIGLSHMEAGQPGGTGAGVKIPFKYNGHGPEDIEYLFKNLVEFTYKWQVISEFGTPGADDHTYILSGKTSPYEGQMGMMNEFASSDGGSGKGGSNIRSRCTYGYDSYEILVSVYANMKLLGGWDSSTEEMQKLDNRIFVGNEDLIFKMQEGYHGFSSGNGSNEYEYGYLSRGHKFVKDMWRNFHCMLDEEVTTTTDPNYVELVEMPEAEPMDGITSAPEGAFPAVLLSSNSTFEDEAYYSIGEELKSGSVEFDIVLGEGVVPEFYDSVVMLEQKTPDLTWGDANMLIQFTQGTIKVRNGAEYVNTKLQFASNYRYHVTIDFDVAAKTYTTSITQIYPTEGETVTATDYAFRSGAHAIDFVDSIAIVNSNQDSIMWVENFKVN